MLAYYRYYYNKKIALILDFYNPATGFLPVTWGNKKVF